MIMGKLEKMVEDYYHEFELGIKTQSLLANYGNRGEKLSTYFKDCLTAAQNTTKEAVKEELFRQLCSKNDAKAAIKAVGEVIQQRTRSLDKLLESLFAQIEQFMVLWDYEAKGCTKYRINAVGESCEECKSKNGRTFNIADSIIGETLAPLHPNCDCTIEILDEQGNVVYTDGKAEQDWEKYLKASLKQLILGNYADDGNLLGTLLQVLAGIVGVDLPMDIRDLFYDVTNFELNKQHIAQTLLDAVALLPIVGGIKYADEAGDILKSGVKYGDEVAEVVRNTQKANNVASMVDNFSAITQKYKLTDGGYFGKQGQGRTFTRNISSKNPETTAKEFYETISQGGIEYCHANGKYSTMSDGTIVSYRQKSSSDGTPVVEINIRQSSDSVGVKYQKIHFTKGN